MTVIKLAVSPSLSSTKIILKRQFCAFFCATHLDILRQIYINLMCLCFCGTIWRFLTDRNVKFTQQNISVSGKKMALMFSWQDLLNHRD